MDAKNFTNSAVIIERVANGWVVRIREATLLDRVVDSSSVFVFNAFSEMVSWLEEHFPVEP